MFKVSTTPTIDLYNFHREAPRAGPYNLWLSGRRFVYDSENNRNSIIGKIYSQVDGGLYARMMPSTCVHFVGLTWALKGHNLDIRA